MLIIPAIDLLHGACVRLIQGDYARATVYEDDPVEVARGFERAGARRIHLVDLDAARGSGTNREVIARIRAAVGCLLEVGGGVRSEGDVQELIAAGVDRIVVGTALARKPEEVARWARTFGRILAGIDARDGRVKIAGWESDSDLSDVELARRAKGYGVLGIVYTDIARDGTLTGPSFDATVRVAKESGLPVILSGGVHEESDFAAAVQHPEIVGVITGKALYEGRFELARVIKQYQKASTGDSSW